MEDNVGKFLILNNDLIGIDKLIDEPCASSGRGLSEGLGVNKIVIYEVIRIIEKVPLFFEDHYERLKESLLSHGFYSNYSEEELRLKAVNLVEANGLENCNVKLTITIENKEQNLLMYISKSYYPSISEINNGVKVGLMNFERKDPQVKKINSTLREDANRIIKEAGVFEVLLVNKEGLITEGSRSNVFFIKGSSVLTSPADVILKGITRKYIMEVCEELGYNVIETMTDVNNLKDIDGLFLSGTSIKVLPVSSIDGYNYCSSQNPVVTAIRKRFDSLMDKYISTHKNF